MDVKFLQHRLEQLRDRPDIGFRPANLRRLVDELVELERNGVEVTSGTILLDAEGELLIENGRPSIAAARGEIPPTATALRPIFYKKDEILVARDAMDAVAEILGRRGLAWEPSAASTEGVENVELLTLRAGSSQRPSLVQSEAGDVDAWDELQAILAQVPGRWRSFPNRERGLLEPPASLNVLFHASGMDCGSPAGDPEEPGKRRPHRGTPGAGQDVTVAVLDSGMLPDYATYDALADNVIFDPALDTDRTYSRGYIHFPGCHGTFVAGVVRRVAPACTIIAVKVLDTLGWGSQLDVARGINRAVRQGANVICLSLTAAIPTEGVTDPDTGLPVDPADVHPLGIGPALADAIASDAAMVGAAGNAGRNEETWPGTLPEVLAVGAVTQKGRLSQFTNFGPWVEVWARGTDVVSAFGTGPYRPVRGGPTRNFAGIAAWSGTSFATPLVAGLIAARMSSDGTTAIEAQKAVLDDCVRRPDLGPGPDGRGAPLVTLDTRVPYPPSPPAPPPGP